MLMRLFRRLSYWLQHRAGADDLYDEMEFHRAARQASLEAQGYDPAHAAAASRRLMGNATLACEDAREVWTARWIDAIRRDLRYAARLLRRQPIFAFTAVVTLAVGIAAPTTVFSIVEAELFRPLPFPEAGRLVSVFMTSPEHLVSPAELAAWQSQSRTLEGLAAIGSSGRRVLRGIDRPQSSLVTAVTPDFFDVLRRAPSRGRSFEPADVRPSGGLLLTDKGWHRLFNGDPDVVGRAITLDNEPFTIVGVSGAPLEFLQEPDVFVAFDPGTTDPGARSLEPVARLKPASTTEAAEAELGVLAQRIAVSQPGGQERRGVRVQGLLEAYTGWNWRPLYFFLGAGVVVLLLACANVANLLLARALTRQGEFAIRGAVGGGRLALVRQLLVEGTLLAGTAALFAVPASAWSVQALSAWIPEDYLTRTSQPGLDGRVYFFAVLIAVLTGVVFGLLPAWFASRHDVQVALARSGRIAGESRSQRGARHALVVVEVALALVLLGGAGLFLNSYVKLIHLPLGFEPVDRLTMRLSLSGDRYDTPRAIASLADQLIERTRSLPGVRDAAAGSSMPLGSGPSANFVVTGQRRPAPADEAMAIVRSVSPGYFRTLNIAQASGRSFTAQDSAAAPRVAVINERLAHRFFPDRSPIGAELEMDKTSSKWVQVGKVQIVGVVSDVKDVGLNEVDFNDIYLPIAQCPPKVFALVVNVPRQLPHTADALRDVMASLDPTLPAYTVKSMLDAAEDARRGDRFNLLLIGSFAVLATLMAATGIYGTMAYSVAQRTQEFGVRLALGARPSDIMRLGITQAARLGILGTVIGLATALAMGRLLGSVLYLVPKVHDGLLYKGVSVADPLTFTTVCVAVMAIAALAGFVPAARSARIDPLVALRQD